MKRHQKKIHEYIAVFQEENEGGYSVWVRDLPGCASQGETIEESVQNIKEAIALYLEGENVSQEENSYKRQFVVPTKISYA